MILEILLCGLIDRLRGDSFDFINKMIEKLVYGWLIATILGITSWLLIATFASFFALGASFGWGEPLGAALEDRKMIKARLEKWQIGPLKKNPWLALAGRGTIWGLCLAPLAYFIPSVIYMIPIFTITMPLAAFLGKFCNKWLPSWEANEYIRGWLVGLMTFLVSYVI